VTGGRQRPNQALHLTAAKPAAGELVVRRQRASALDDVTADIDRRLAATRVPGSPNEFTAAEICDLAVEYLGFHDEEVRGLPEIAGQPHWNLWMADARLEDALFAVLVFRPGGVEFVCGTGDAFAIRRFAESDFPDDIERVPAEMSRRFAVPAGSLHLSREAAEGWLGRGW
jgi:hypothetical protein